MGLLLGQIAKMRRGPITSGSLLACQQTLYFVSSSSWSQTEALFAGDLNHSCTLASLAHSKKITRSKKVNASVDRLAMNE